MTRNTLVVAATLVLGCINPPPIVMVDRATALEQQAGGTYADLEKRLARVSVASHPIPFTPEELEALGLTTPPLIDRTDITDADRIDDLLQRHCVGEGLDGSLVDTPDACHGVTDHEALLVLVDRVNRARSQLWRWMQQQRPDATIAEIRKRWRDAHVHGVACGGWVQKEDGQWAEKGC